jgi:N-acetylneuraminic acid mutarotase
MIGACPDIIPEEAAMSQPSIRIAAGLIVFAAGFAAPLAGAAAEPVAGSVVESAAKSPFAVEQIDLSDMPERIVDNTPDAPVKLEWHRLPNLSDPQGFAGQFVGVADNRLLLYGGSNFPDTPVWAGGTKRWYRDAFVLDAPDGTWRKIGSLDETRPVGYGVSLPTADGKFLCIGGADAERHYDSTFVLGLEGDKLTATDLAKLPRPCAYTAGAILHGKVYVAGGIDRPDATRGMRTFWSLDLAKPEAGWQELPAWPGRGRMLATVAVDDEYLYLTGGCDLSSDVDGKPLRLYLRDTFRYSPKTGWQKTADAPVGIVAAPTPALTLGKRVIVFGGDDSTHLGFRPPDKHPGFPNNVYAFDVEAERWSRIGRSAFVPVASPVVKWLDGHVVASGEIRPGVRTREVWLVKPHE